MAEPAARPEMTDRPLPLLHELLRGAACVGLALVLTVPAARGHHDWLGWMPLWLVGMPLASLWAVHRFSLPRLVAPVRVPARKPRGPAAIRARPRRRAGLQASLHRAA